MLLPQGRIQHSSKAGGSESIRKDFNLVSCCVLFVIGEYYLSQKAAGHLREWRGVRTPCNLLQIHTCTTREENKYNPLLPLLIHLTEGVGSHPHLTRPSHHPATCVAKFHSNLTNTFKKKEDVTEIMIGLTDSTQSASAQPSICHNSYGKN